MSTFPASYEQFNIISAENNKPPKSFVCILPLYWWNEWLNFTQNDEYDKDLIPGIIDNFCLMYFPIF